MKSLTRVLLFAFLCLLPSTLASAEEWANLTGRFLYEEAPPVRKEIQITKATRESYDLPADFKLYEESLIADPKTKGIANIAIYAAPEVGKIKMPVHADLLAATSPAHQIEILHMAFTPHVSIMRVDQTLVVTNNDAAAHVPRIDPSSSSFEPFIKISAAKVKVEKKFDKPALLPYTLSCAVQPYMRGYLIVRDNPYFAVTDAQGRFEIKNAPVGKWRFQFWHEKSGYVTSVKVGDAAQTWVKGQVEIDIPREGKSLGDMLVNELNFKK
jgi:hypothetical protein